MKQITLNHVNLQTTDDKGTRCDFCGERDKHCIKGSTPIEVDDYQTEIVRVGSLLTGYRFVHAIKNYFSMDKKTIGYPAVCMDCIMSMSLYARDRSTIRV